MKTVWIVERNIDYEGAFILGVYDNKFEAQLKSDELNERNLMSIVTFSYTEYEVQA